MGFSRAHEQCPFHFQTTLILYLLFAVAFAVCWFKNSHAMSTEKASAEIEAQEIHDFPEMGTDNQTPSTSRQQVPL
jgi:hypothetical protein